MGQIWAFDCEWTPDLAAGRRLFFPIGSEASDEEVLKVMWERGGATESNPQPFLKTIQCKLCSIAAVVKNEEGKLILWSCPSLFEREGAPFVDDPAVDEAAILHAFLDKYETNLGKEERKPKLVGYNSRNADIHILIQRAIVNGLQLHGFYNEATAKPWQQTSVDLMDVVGGRGSGYGCSLNEIATLCGIPGKLDTHGDDVAGLYYGGKRRKIVEYNMFDAITTYLVWLRLEYFSGNLTADAYREEQQKMRDLLEVEVQKPHGAYLKLFIERWKALTPSF